MGIRLTWTNHTDILEEEGVRVYRSTSTIDPQSLPAPVATLAPGSSEYDDGTVTSGLTYYYRVGSYSGLVEAISDEVSLVATESPGAYPLEYVAVSDTGITDGTTNSVSITLPAEILDGDFLVLTTLTRSAITDPTGWTKVGEVGPTDDYTQSQQVYVKQATLSDAGSTLTITQATANRTGAHCTVLRPAISGQGVVVDFQSAFNNTAEVDIPPTTTENRGQIIIIAQTWVWADPDEFITPPAGYTTISSAPIDNLRIGVCYKISDVGEISDGEITHSNTTKTDMTGFRLLLGTTKGV